jgi:hydrogenase nickel incorporation protein HypA/HybF
MHELGIAQDFWAIIKQEAAKSELKIISKIVIVLGEASGIEEDFLVHSLKDHTLPGTIADKAVLEIIKKPLSAKCKTCGKDITKDNMTEFNCPACKSTEIEIISGKETYVQNIEGE